MILRPRLLRESWIVLLVVSAPATPAAAFAFGGSTSNLSASDVSFQARVEAPEGFEDLTASREILADLYVGGRRVGEARLIIADGSVRFLEPASIVALVPNLRDQTAAAAALEGELPANAAKICTGMNSLDCGRLNPEVAGVIFDEDKFRIDLFFAPNLLSPVSSVAAGYLDTPRAGMSLASSFGFTLSGSGDHRSYQLQARNIVGLRNGRLRSNAVLASKYGFLFDDLVGEIDRPGWRYSGGLFWAPGSDFTGRRRVLGIGVGTQLDTRIDRDTMQGTPLPLFLQSPARVDVLIDGRLVGSRVYDAGNNLLDTSTLPAGSYPVTLRINEGGASRTENRFFVRTAAMAPLGHTQYYAFAGLMANTHPGRPISLADSFYLRAGSARRLSREFGVEAAVSGTNRKAIGEVGAVWANRLATVRALGLFSSRGDRGMMAQVSSGDLGPISFTVDARRIRSADGGPILPAPDSLDTFAGGSPTPAQVAGGRYTQVTGTAGLHLGDLNFQLLGFFRRDARSRSTYSVGPSINWRLIQLPGMQLTLTADAQRTQSTTAAFLGARMLINRGGFSVASTAGASTRSEPDGWSARSIGSISGQLYRQIDEQTQLNALATIDRSTENLTAQAGASLQSRFGSVQGDILHRFNAGDRAGTDYILNLQSGAAVTAGAAQLGGRNLDESAIIARVAGDGGPFEVLVDDVPQGRIKANGSLPLFLRPYRTYYIRLRSLGERASEYDSSVRKVTLYPGNVVQAVWHAAPVVTVFGRALDVSGRPVRSALVEAQRASGQTDDEGWFQVDLSGEGRLVLSRDDGSSCEVELGPIDQRNEYLKVGDVVCR